MRKLPYAIFGLIIAFQSKAADLVPYGDWATGGQDGFMFAATANDSGEVFGEYCYFKSKKCFWYILMRTGCTPGIRTPVLANSDATAAPLTVICNGQMPGGADQLYSDGFEDWKTLEGVLTDSIRIGFAIPLAADRFTVVRFSLKGRTTATSAMEAAFFSKIGRAHGPQQGTEDQQL